MTTVSLQLGSPHLHHTRQGRSFPLDQPVTTLGRGVSNQVPLQGERISRRHALVVRDGARFVLHDLGSLNGVWLNTEPLDAGAQRPLRDGDLIRVGDQQLVFRHPRPAPPKAKRKAPKRAKASKPKRRVRRTRDLSPRDLTRDEVRLRRAMLTVCVLLLAILGAALSLVIG